MSKELNLSEVADGVSVKIKSLKSSDLKVKLMEMGLIEGRNVEVLFRAPFGDPIAVNIDGYVLSLRNDEARMIAVEPLTESDS